MIIFQILWMNSLGIILNLELPKSVLNLFFLYETFSSIPILSNFSLLLSAI